MHTEFNFDRLAELARTSPTAFEAQRLELFETALARMPPEKQVLASVALAAVQVRMARARNPAERLAAAMTTMAESIGQLHQALSAVRSEANLHGRC